MQGERPEWKCRAGARYLYVDEHGDVQFCASQLGRFSKPILDYTKADLDEQAQTHKGCEEGCSVGCAFRCSLVDDDKPAFIKAVAKGYVKGTMWNNGERRPVAPQPATEPVLSDD